jgi:hypothetical protein
MNIEEDRKNELEERERIREEKGIASGRLRGVLFFFCVAVAALLIIGAFVWYKHKGNEAERESQNQDFALCTIQNENREAVRVNSTVMYALVASVLKAGGPDDPSTKRIFKRQLRVLEGQVTALKPIDCSTYKRPVPPDTGIH